MTIVPTAVNGKIPVAFLAALPGTNGNGSPHLADRLAVASYGRLSRDFAAAGNGNLLPTPGWSCYRSLADQAYMRSLGLTTIPVGKSIHGESLAVDYQGVPFGSARHNWLKANAGRYGWYQPAWAKVTGSLPEPWHWEYDYRLDTQPARSDDDGGLDVTQLDTIQGQGDALLAYERIPGQPYGRTEAILSALTAPSTGVAARLADVQLRIRGTDPAGDMLQITLSEVKAVHTDTAVIKGGIATIIDLLNGGASRPDGSTPAPGPVVLSDEQLDAIADRVAARLYNGPEA